MSAYQHEGEGHIIEIHRASPSKPEKSIDSVKVLRHTRPKMGHFGDVLPS